MDEFYKEKYMDLINFIMQQIEDIGNEERRRKKEKDVNKNYES